MPVFPMKLADEEKLTSVIESMPVNARSLHESESTYRCQSKLHQ